VTRASVIPAQAGIHGHGAIRVGASSQPLRLHGSRRSPGWRGGGGRAFRRRAARLLRRG